MSNRRNIFLIAIISSAMLVTSAYGQLVPKHRWSFNETSGISIEDSLGGADGEVIGTGWTLGGGSLTLPGGPSASAPYADLPNGIISGLTSATVEGWITINGTQSWARVFDFGSSDGGELFAPGGGGDGQDYFMLSVSRGTNNNQQRFELRNRDPLFGGSDAGIVGDAQQILDTDIPSTIGEEYHFAAVYDANGPNGPELRNYRNGVLQGTNTVNLNLGNMNDVNNWLGRSNWVNDANFEGSYNEFRIYEVAMEDGAVEASFAAGPDTDFQPFSINGSGQTYHEDFDGMGTRKSFPKGWKGENIDGETFSIKNLGLIDGPLDGPVASASGVLNLGGNAERFSTPGDGRLGTWQDDLDNDNNLSDGDVIADDAADRALGNGRVLDDEVGKLLFEVEISDKPLRALVANWDLEIWGGDPEAVFRGAEGGGYSTDLFVGGTSYHSQTVSLLPGELFDSSFDGSPGATQDPTLINGNEHAVRGNSSGIIEVSSADGAVGNTISWTFDANHGGADGGWIQAVDNVTLRALAAGDAQADGDVDPADLIQLLAGGAFGQGNIDATWGQGDFDNDGDFDGTDILAVVQGLAGEFPKTYAHDPNNDVPDVLINPATGNITLDTNGTTIGSIVMDSVAGIFNGPNSPSWDAPGDFAADIDTQISMPISFTNPGYTGIDDLGDGIIGDLPPGFDILGDLTIKYLDPNGDLLDAEAHVIPEPSSIVLAAFGVLGMLGYLWQRRRLS